MDTLDFTVMIALIGPLYAMLGVIYTRLGQLDRVVKDFDRLRDQHDAQMLRGGHDS
jgi:hypothetical protein